jgi:uncharacterized protein (TIGR02145 family)
MESIKKGILFIALIGILVSCESDPELNELPSITTGNASSISYTTATVSYTMEYTSAVESAGIVWNTESTFENDSHYVSGYASTGTHTISLTSLPNGTTIYYKAYVEDKGSWHNLRSNFLYGEVKSIKTQNIILPVVTTSEVSDVLEFSATCGGNTTLGTFSITERGICYNTSANPTINDTKITSGTLSGAYTSTITGLYSDTRYYVRAYAIDSYGNCIYGNTRSFSTKKVILPIVTTSDLSDIFEFTAVCGGTITLGSFSITERGVCFNTYGSPTIYDTKLSNGTEPGTYSSKLIGLTQNTTYYVRAYAIDSYGNCGYGAEESFTTIKQETGTFIDARDNVTYKWVKIGNQVWMVENLKATYYNDGTYIPSVTDETQWSNLTTGAYCYYKNYTSSKYRCLYNWYAVNTGKLAPNGWHIPTDEEWTTLSNYLGGEAVAGGYLKSTTEWTSSTGTTNSSGFSAVPGGERTSMGYFYGAAYSTFGGTMAWFSDSALFGFWWSATVNDSSYPCGRGMSYNTSTIDRSFYDKKCGFSVRCVRDN